MRRMRSKLNNLVYPTESGVNATPVEVHGVGLNRQTSAIQSQLQAAGIHPQQMMPEMYDPTGFQQPFAQQAYPHMHNGMQQGMAPQMQMPQQAPMAQPMMYPAAQQQMPAMAQTAQPMPDSGMDHVKAGLDQLSAHIQQLAANNAGGQDTVQAQKQNEMITAELMELRKQIALTSEQGGHQDLTAQMEAIRQAVEAALAKSTNPEVFASVVEASHKKISDELYEFKNALSNNNANPEVFAHTFEARHDEISRSINDLQHSINAAIGNPGLYAETVENSHRDLSQQFEEFKQTMLEQSEANQQIDMPDFSALEMRLEEITRAIVALSTGSQDQDGLERIEARISDLAKTISSNETTAAPVQMADYDDHFNQVHHNLQVLDARLSELQPSLQNDTGSLDLQIQQISDKMDALSGANQQISEASLQCVGDLEENIKLLSEKLENIALTSTVKLTDDSPENLANVDNSALIGRLDDLVGEVVNLRADGSKDKAMAKHMTKLVMQLESFNNNQASGDNHTDQIIAHLKDLSQSVDKLSKRDTASGQHSDLTSLETQLTQISQQLGEGGQASSVEGLPIDEISQRLIGIEQQIGASRDIAIELASQAATDAVQRTMSEVPAEGADGSTLQLISENIQNLNEHTATAHAQYIEQLDALKTSLMELADRNNQLENKIAGIDHDENLINNDSHEAQQGLISESAYDETQNNLVDETVESKPEFADNFNRDEIIDEEISTNDESTEVIAEQSQQEDHSTYDTEYTEHESEFSQTNTLLEGDADEQNHTSQNAHAGESTADLINKIRENARAEQLNTEDAVAASKNSQQNAEQVLAEATGHKYSPTDLIAETAIEMEAQQEALAQHSYDAHITQEVNAVYEDVSSLDALSAPEIAQEYQASTFPTAEEGLVMGDSPQDSLQNLAHQNQLPHVDVPSLDTDHEDDMPLEPGSAGPDLAALVRQVNERRMDSTQSNLGASGSDFLASARRAAQAAAQEANMVEEEIEQNEKKGLLASLPELLGKKKKLLMIGVAAVAMIAIAIPFLSGSPKAPNENIVIEQSNNTEISEATENREAVFSEEPISEGDDVAALDAEIQDVSESEAATGASQAGNESIVTPANAAEIQIQVDTAETAGPATTALETYDVSKLDFVTPELRDAVSQGNLIAIFEVGRRYTNGEGTKKDLVEAATWYERAANHGYAPAQYIFGNFNEKGYGMEPNIETAVNWYKKAADQGNVIAMHNLGVIYATPGKLNEQADMTQAFNWFNQAADHGVRDSQVNMGIFHTKGLGTEIDLTKAYKWLSIASADGDADAKKKVSFIEERLRPEQLLEAKKLVENWKPAKVDIAVNEVMIPDAWKKQVSVQPIPKVDKKTIQQTQAVLNKLGYKAGVPDGIMGEQTKQAISKYQQTEGLNVTGTINPELVKSLIAKMSG